jgi:tetratricopeptide (TPR) repeat protein
LQTSAVDKQYKRNIEQQQRKAEFSEEAEIEKKLPPANNPETFEQMGDVYLRQDNLGMTFIEYNKALKAGPDRIRTRQKVAYLMLKRGKWDDAVTEFDIILRQAPGNTVALQGKGTALLQLNRLKDAEQTLNVAIGYDSRLWHAYALLGIVYDRQKLHESVIKAYKKAITINPKIAGAYSNLGVSLYLTGQYQESADALLKAINLDTSHSKTYNNLGLSLFEIGLFPEAHETFKKGDEASAYNNMGVLYMETKNYAKSIEFFEKAIEAKPRYYEKRT